MNLKAGDILKLSWEARNNKMVVVVRNANVTSTIIHEKKQELEFKEKRKLKSWHPENFLVPIVTSQSAYTFQKMHERQHTKCEDKDTTYHNLVRNNTMSKLRSLKYYLLLCSHSSTSRDGKLAESLRMRGR